MSTSGGFAAAVAPVNSAAPSTQGSLSPRADAYAPPSTAEGDVPPSATPAAPTASEDAHSQPVAAAAPASSLTAGVDNVDDSQNVYGTRSRNRTGGTRPNYADDKELDLEIEAAGRISNAMASGDATPQSAARASTPSSAPVVSKKRKHPGSQTSTAAAHAHSAHSLDSRSRHSGSASSYVETNMMSFQRVGSRLNAKKQLVADDGTVLQADDHAYFVCEPPGEPYYLARIMEFLHAGNDPSAPIDAIRVNWFYRPKDIGRRVQDTRVVFASMHSDTCPLASLRGKCTIQHINDIASLDQYRTQKDCFWFDKLYDRYMLRYYEVVPTSKVVNVPPRVKDVLDARWKFVLIEVGRARDLTTESKKCVRCEQFAANSDSVDCAVCKNTYHMRCVRPPLLKKPARGFAWACAPCSRKQELRMEAQNTPSLAEAAPAGDDEPLDEDDDDLAAVHNHETRASSITPDSHAPPIETQVGQANRWPWRYLGVHSRPEDALDYDDRIYPRASSRLGPRHQANVNVWHGRPVELVKSAEIKRKYMKNAGSKKDGKMTKDTLAAIEADKESRLKRPKWVLDEPVGYIARGSDEPIEIKGKKEHTAQLTFKMPDASMFSNRGGDDSERPRNADALVDEYMERVKPLAARYDIEPVSVDFLTKAMEKLQANDYNIEQALAAMQSLSKRADLKMPDLNREEIKRFEEGVQRYGSELHAVSRHVGGSVKESRIVRFYYMWKKTDRGRQIWGNYEGRRSKQESRKVDKDGGGKPVDDVADDADDSAFDSEKASLKKRGFECKFCGTRSSRQWRRAPATAPGTLVPRDASHGTKNPKDKSTWLLVALCGRCAYLWRRYAIQYESIEEVARKIAAAGGRASKRKVDEELLRTTLEAHSKSGDLIPLHVANEVQKTGVELPSSIIQTEEPPKKKSKPEKETAPATPEAVTPKAVEAPLAPEPPRVKIHPCAVCHVIEVPGHELLKCRDCRLHVHGACYGVADPPSKPWFCDMCRNDHKLQVSTIYECLLCPVVHTHQELMEPLKVSHKKKSDREREKERLEREMVQEASRRWRQDQEAAGRPVNPREALKRTAWNNWVHITCALWTKEIKFGNAKLLDDAEGVGFIPRERFEHQCKICRKGADKPTVKCSSSVCNGYFHVGCAHQANYIMGFDVALVKGSRRDSVNIMKLDQETGIVTPGIWCPAHAPTTYVHSIVELTEDGKTTALQKYAEIYKQADTSITGTVRRAAQFTTNIHSTTAPAVQPPQRQSSLSNGVQTEYLAHQTLQASPVASAGDGPDGPDGPVVQSEAEVRPRRTKKCCTCLVEASPKWWEVPQRGPSRDRARSETSSQLANGIPPPAVPSSGSIQGRDDIVTNGVVKHEPSESGPVNPAAFLQGDYMYQCHKCHVQKKSPPSSPSQIRARERPRVEAVPEPAYQPPGPPPAFPPYPRPALDPAPPHTHPAPGPVAPHHSPWQAGPAQWSNPVIHNGPPRPPPPNGPPSYETGPLRPPETSYNFPPRAGASPYAPAHHSPPQPPFVMTSHGAPPPVPRGPPAVASRALSPSRPGYEYGANSGLDIGAAGSARGYASDGPRRGSFGSPVPVNGFPPGSRAPGYGAPPAPAPRAGPAQAQSLAQIAQAAEAATSLPPPPIVPPAALAHGQSRRPSDGPSGPGAGGRVASGGYGGASGKDYLCWWIG
ncbi:hypothetical protein DV735_g376, partial [Chaetothyriales sp. CBS 134920]